MKNLNDIAQEYRDIQVQLGKIDGTLRVWKESISAADQAKLVIGETTLPALDLEHSQANDSPAKSAFVTGAGSLGALLLISFEGFFLNFRRRFSLSGRYSVRRFQRKFPRTYRFLLYSRASPIRWGIDFWHDLSRLFRGSKPKVVPAKRAPPSATPSSPAFDSDAWIGATLLGYQRVLGQLFDAPLPALADIRPVSDVFAIYDAEHPDLGIDESNIKGVAAQIVSKIRELAHMNEYIERLEETYVKFAVQVIRAYINNEKIEIRESRLEVAA